MGRKLRYLPGNNHLVEVTCRVIQRRFLLRPCPRLNEVVIGTLARFQKRHAMKICHFVYLSNHSHLLLRPESVEQLSAFMRDVNSKIAREVGRLHGWREKVWGRRYTDVVVSEEPEAQFDRLRYVLQQGCKEGLVASPRHWPGATATRALLSGDDLEGIWIDRTKQFRAGARNEPNTDERFCSVHRLRLSPLPCCDEMSPHAYRRRVRAIVREIEGSCEGTIVLGRKAICEQDPRQRPASVAVRRPAPRFHTTTTQVRRVLETGYHLMRISYRQAWEDRRAGRAADFPAGCFTPGRFVPLRC